MLSLDLYLPIVFVISLLYTVTFAFCMYRTNKFNYFNDEWRHTKLFYLSVTIQSFIRMTTYSLLTFAVPESSKNEIWISLMLSVPDTLFFINYCLLGYQTLNIFYHSHMENNIQISLLLAFTRPKFSTAKKLIALLILAWLGFMSFMYSLFVAEVIDMNDLKSLFTIVNLVTGTFVLVFLMYLYSQYQETPFRSQAEKQNLQIASKVLLIWTLGRYFEGFLGLLHLRSASFLNELSNPQSTTIGGAMIVVGQCLISEIFCFIIVMDYRFINIFIAQEKENLKTDDENFESAESLLGFDEGFNDFIGNFFEVHDIVIKEPMYSIPNSLGKLLKASFRNKEVMYRSIRFSRVSGYVLEDIKKEIESLKEKNCGCLNHFYGAVLNLPEIGLITEMAPYSLFKRLHEDNIIMSTKEKINLIRDIAFVIQNIHEKSFFHGHLTSHNILLYEGYKPVICDLGLEKLKKYAGIIMNYSNKSPWSSPEVLKDSSKTVTKPNGAHDIYSFGIIIWEIITGEIPFHDLPQSQNYIEEIVNHGLTPHISSFFSLGLRKILEKCWAEEHLRPSIQTIYEKLSKLAE